MRSKTKKLIWLAPVTAVMAVVAALAIFAAQTPGEAAAQTNNMPGAVLNLTVAPYTDGTPQEQLLVSWDAPATGGAVTSYRIDISNDGTRWLAFKTDHGTSDTRLVYPTSDNIALGDSASGLKAETKRYFRVFAFYDASATSRVFGPGSDASGTTAASTAPGLPTDLLASDATANLTNVDFNMDGDTDDSDLTVKEEDFGLDLNGDGDLLDTVTGLSESSPPAFFNQTVIRVTWEAPEDPPGAPVTNYDVRVSADGINYSTLARVGDVTTYYHGGLLAEAKRWYRVRAVNSVGVSSWSDGDTGKTSPSVAPGAITNPVIGLEPGGNAVHLTWTPPSDPPGDPVTHYRIQARQSAIGANDINGNGAVDACEAAVTAGTWKSLSDSKHISKRKAYEFTGADIDDADITVPASIVAPCTYLAEIDIRIAAINRVNTDVADTNTTVDVGVTWFNLTSVPVGHENAPMRPTSAPTVKKDDGENQGRSGLNVTWPTAKFLAGKGPTTNDFGTQVVYHLVVDGVAAPGEGLTHTSALDDPTDSTKPSRSDDGLVTETTMRYSYQVRNTTITVENASVRSLPSREGSGTTDKPIRPGSPISFSVAPDGHTEIKLDWAAPTRTLTEGGAHPCDNIDAASGANLTYEEDGSECGTESAITGYKIQRSATGSNPWTTIATVDETDYLDTMLAPGTRYHYRVSTENSRYTSAPTASKSAATYAASNPTPPGGLIAQAVDYDSIKLCWYEQNTADPSQPLSENLPLLGYMITYVDGKEEKVLHANTGSTDTEFQDDTVPPGTTREYRVRALTLGNIDKTGDALLETLYISASATSDAASAPGMPTVTTPAKVDSDTAVTVSWTAPTENGGAPITGYKVMWKMDSATDYADADMATAAADATMHQVTGLTASTDYTFKVAAMNAKGDSADSDAAMATTDRSNVAPEPVGTISDVTVTDSGDGSTKTSKKAAAAYFSDADAADATLAITFASSDATVATAALNDAGMIVVTGMAVGSAVITVTATDTGNMAGTLSAKQTFTVTVRSAVLTQPTLTATAGTEAGTVDLTWDVAGGVSYIVWGARPNAGPVKAGSANIFVEEATTDTSMTVEGLMSGEVYMFVVEPCSGAAASSCKDAATRLYSEVMTVTPQLAARLEGTREVTGRKLSGRSSSAGARQLR